MKTRIATWLALSLTAPLVSCGGKAATTTETTPRASSLLEATAAELDVGPQQPLWSRLPAGRDAIERGTTVPSTDAARIELARARFALWDQSMEHLTPEAVTARLAAGLEALYLVEPVVFASAPSEWTPLQREGASLLYDLYARLDQPVLVTWLRGAGRTQLDGALLDVVLREAPTMRRYLAAHLLRTGALDTVVMSILRDIASRKSAAGDVQGARGLYDEVVQRRGTAASASDWVDAGLARVRSEDAAAARDALEKATAAARSVPADRALGARVRSLRQEVRTLERYQAAKPATEIEQKLLRFDLLHGFGRSSEAGALLAELVAAHPNDARVRVRTVVEKIDEMAVTGDAFAAAGAVAKALDGDLENMDGDYWSLVVGSLGFRAMTEVLAVFQRDKVAGAQRMVEMLQYMREVSRELAKTRPGRAAALDVLLAKALTVFDSTRPFEQELGDVLQHGFADAVALRQQHPDTADVDRILYSFASFTSSLDAALAAVTAPPATSSDDDGELYFQRAQVAISIARQLATPAATATACATIEDIPPGFDRAKEAGREALLGDCAALAAVTARDASGWPRAIAHYTAALSTDVLADDRPRLLNNLAFATLQTGDRDTAVARYTEAAALESGRQFLPRFQVLSLTTNSPAERLVALRVLGRELAAGGAPTSIYLGTWLAHLSDDPVESRQAAQAVLDAMADTFRTPSPAAFAHGLESEGTFQVGLGLASRQLYALNVQVFSSVWFVAPPPLDRAGLEAKAKEPAKPAKPARPPRR